MVSMPISPLIVVEAQARGRVFTRAGSPISTYEEVFERDAKWMTGRRLLSDIVGYIKGKPLAVNRRSKTEVSVEIPLPMVRDEISGEFVGIALMVPPELSGIFGGRLNEAMRDYLGEGGVTLLEGYLHSPMEPSTIRDMQSSLLRIERDRQASGEGELWQVVAEHFGLEPFAIQATMTFSSDAWAG